MTSMEPQSGDNHHAASYLPAAAHGLQPNPVASGRATRQRQSPRRRRALQLLGVAVTVIVDVDVFGCAGERRQEGRARAGRGVPGLRGAAVPGRGRRRDAHRVLRDGRGEALRHGLRQVRARLLRRRSRHRRAAQARRAHQYTLHGEVSRRDGVRQQLQAREATDDAHRRRQDPPRASTGDRRRRRRDAHARRWEAQAHDTSDFGLRARTSRLLLRGLQHSWELHDTIRHPPRWHLQVSV